MENLTKEQIDAIVKWMEGWEPLKGTVVPLRFKEDFSNHIHFKVHLKASQAPLIRPPKGIVPKYIWDEQRKEELKIAIESYLSAGFKVPEEWIKEFNEYC